MGYIIGVIYRDSGKDNGSYCIMIGYILGL